ncbi:CDP-glycerol glycerophosphotransferase family protein [Pseudomonas anuradhapurensis]
MTGLLDHAVTVPYIGLYLDPGTGSLLFSLIAGVVTTAFYSVKGLYYRFGGGGKGVAATAEGSVQEAWPVVIYSEGRQYYGTFRPLLAALAKARIRTLYLSSDSEDPGLQAWSEVTGCYIGSGHKAWALLARLRADLCISTTPGLDVMQFKRSKRVRHYMHLVHAPTDKAFNRPYSFDYFDSVVINGPHQERTLRYLEQLRGLPAKDLIMGGCLYYDDLLEQLRNQTPELVSPGRTVLLAPTWGRNGLLRLHGSKLLSALTAQDINLIIRPHPQSMVSEPELIQGLQALFPNGPRLQWDFSSTPFSAMARSDVMVSDISGVIFDYAFLFERPVITVGIEPVREGTEASDLPYDPWELTVLDDIGLRLSEEQIPRLTDYLPQVLEDSRYPRNIRHLREQYVVNFGHAVGPILKAIEPLIGQGVSEPSAAALSRQAE